MAYSKHNLSLKPIPSLYNIYPPNTHHTNNPTILPATIYHKSTDLVKTTNYLARSSLYNSILPTKPNLSYPATPHKPQ
jgi:hypothetical protein